MSNVHLGADGKYTVSAGDSTSAYDTLREALDAALPAVAAHEKQARLRNPDSGELNGAWRWLPATDVEPAAIGGVRIDAKAIHEMADSLNTRPGPIPIDGGPTPAGMLASDVHGTAVTGGGTPANGWAHWGVVVDGPGAEQAKLYLYAELVPEVAREVDAGRMATGSVHFGASSVDGELPRGVELISHALTNDPAVKTLESANSVRNGPLLISRSVHQGVALRARTPLMESKTMATKNAQRGPAADALAKLYTMFAVDPKSTDAEWKLHDAICAIKSAAASEGAVEAVNGAGGSASGTGAMVAASAARAALAKLVGKRVSYKDAEDMIAALLPGVAKEEIGTELLKLVADVGDRNANKDKAPASTVDSMTEASADHGKTAERAAVAGLADEGAKDAFITQLLGLLAKNGVSQDGDTAAAALSALDAYFQADAQEPGEDAGATATTADAAARANVTPALDTMRSEIATLRKELEDARPFVAKQKAAEHADYLDAALRRAGKQLTPNLRTKWLALSREQIDANVEVLMAPATGEVMPTTRAAITSAADDGALGPDDDVRAMELARDRVRAEKPGITQVELNRLALERARRDFPAVFRNPSKTAS